MGNCLNCNKAGYHIADGLHLCAECEKTQKFHLVKNIETNKYYWKNVEWCVCDELIGVEFK